MRRCAAVDGYMNGTQVLLRPCVSSAQKLFSGADSGYDGHYVGTVGEELE